MFHEVIHALVFPLFEAEAVIEPHGRIFLFDMNGKRFSCFSRLIYQVLQNGAAKALSLYFGYQGDVDNPVFAGPAFQVKPANRSGVSFYHQPEGIRIMLLIMSVLGLELHRDKGLLIGFRPRSARKLGLARRTV